MDNVTEFEIIMTSSASHTMIRRMVGELNTLGYDQYDLWGSNLVSHCKAWNSSDTKDPVIGDGSYPELAMYRALIIARAGGWESYLDGIGLEKVEEDK